MHHEASCLEKWNRAQEEIPKKMRARAPRASTAIIAHHRSSGSSVADIITVTKENSYIALTPCPNKCGRTFHPDRLHKHIPACISTNGDNIDNVKIREHFDLIEKPTLRRNFKSETERSSVRKVTDDTRRRASSGPRMERMETPQLETINRAESAENSTEDMMDMLEDKKQVAFENHAENANTLTENLEMLEVQKKAAIEAEEFVEAAHLKTQLENITLKLEMLEVQKKAELEMLEVQKKAAIEAEDYMEAAHLKTQIANLKKN